MSARLHRFLYLATGLACLPGFAAAQADGLKHDPFARPMLAPPPVSAAAAPAYIARPQLPEPIWNPELRAIVLAGSKSIVDVGGTLVRIGEHINGYRLAEVHEETAVFVNDKKRVTLSLRAVEPLRIAPPRQDEPDLKERRDQTPKDDRGTNERRDAPPDERAIAPPRDDSSKPEVK